MPNQQKPTRPCGPRDGRLRISRCAGCRRARTGCDGQRPCSRCQSRGIACTEMERPNGSEVVFVDPSTAKHRPKLPLREGSPPLTPEVWHYFLSAVGDASSPWVSAFERSFVEAHAKTCGPIGFAVAAVSNAKKKALAAKLRNNNSMSIDEDAIKERASLRGHLSTLLPEPGRPVDERALLMGLLLCIYEVMIDLTGLGFLSTVENLSSFFRKCPAVTVPHLYPNKHLIIVYEAMEGTKSLILDEDTYLADAGLIKGREDLLGNATIIRPDLDMFQIFCSFEAVLARANVGSVNWLHLVRSLPENGSVPQDAESWKDILAANGLLDIGYAAILEGRRAFAILNKLSEEHSKASVQASSDFASLRLAFYNCGLISLIRIFTDPRWLHIDPAPPASEHTANLEILASSFLKPLEERLPHVSLESVTIMPLLLVASLEVMSAWDKERIVAMLTAISSGGFIVADTYKADIQMAWRLGDHLASSRGQGSSPLS